MTTTEVREQDKKLPARQEASREPERAVVPSVDVLEDDTGITLLADLPGVAREQLELRVEGDTLQIEAGLSTVMPADLQPVYAEVRVPRYRRAFTLSRELDAARIEANLKDGVLRLRIPKQAHAQPRRIEVKAS
ncbi:MAG TPA: Hsp20/alpha crystallin family protein [Burkholderiaceae bacterium]|jgi:HSP20 family molecular chaperone IbpA|nr:Hsp20/alpha crystallin family protein [Burkholderiaceae bacterium]